MNNIDFDGMLRFIPSSSENLGRLKHLKHQTGNPRVAVFGKYNHGKSTLLNALIGQDIFSAADKRETLVNKEYEHEGVVWVDTPGLDADVHGQDDKEARNGAFKIADFLFLVHNVKAGELDKYEQQLYRDLMKQDRNYKSKMFLVLTQIDQLPSDDLQRVMNSINQQMPDITIIPVSAMRYLRGIREEKSRFVEVSGMNGLFNLTHTLKEDITQFRQKEIKRLVDKTRIEIFDLLDSKNKELASLVAS
ncbi:MAG: GTPase [Endozoicomonas sp.]|uniref:GTPase n=1 Tax=Endozoicomonas sp. TaxID=1892382 RepID=UPI003D9BDFEF